MAVLHVDESNDDGGESVAEAIGSILLGNVDAFDLDPTSAALTPGDNSFEKWLRFHFSDLEGATSVGELKVWGDAPSDTECTYHYNGSTSEGTYDGANHKQTGFSAPAATSTRTPEAFPTSEPGSANMGIGGDLTGELSAPGRSDYFLLQVRTTISATAGDTTTVFFAYAVTG